MSVRPAVHRCGASTATARWGGKSEVSWESNRGAEETFSSAQVEVEGKVEDKREEGPEEEEKETKWEEEGRDEEVVETHWLLVTTE